MKSFPIRLCKIVGIGLGLSLIFIGLHSVDAQASELQIQQAWIRAMPPTARVVPIYLSLTNPSDTSYYLNGISSDTGAIELHQSVMENDVMFMRAVPQIEIPAHSTVKLEPMGFHGMMVNFSQGVPTLGEQIGLILHLGNGDTVAVNAIVAKEAISLTADAQEHDHSAHH